MKRDEQIIEALVGHLRNDTTDMGPANLHLPVKEFIDDAHAARERSLIRTFPVVVAHASELPQNGMFITRDVVGVPLIIVRSDEGTVRSYLNICRHRGGRLENEASGTKRIFSCNYHGWSYERDNGDLRTVPYRQSFGDLDEACSGLIVLQSEERHGLIWVVLDHAAETRSIAEYLGPDVDAQLTSFGLADSVLVIEREVQLDLNWKLVMDGAIDVLHPKFLHPDGVGKLLQTCTHVWREYGRHGQLFTPRKKMAKLVRAGTEIGEMWPYIASNLVVYPNSMAIAAPDHTEFWTVWPSPTDALKCSVVLRFLIPASLLDEEMRERVQRSFDILMEAALEEDWPMAATIQANALIDPDGEFQYGRNEQPCQHLHRRLHEDLTEV